MKTAIPRMVCGLVVAAFLAACTTSDLPPFDYQKAQVLSAEKRREYDLIFFNEMETWNLDSTRYGEDSPRKRRAEFEQMARDGYLPAYAAIRLVGFWPAELKDDPEAISMLLAAADAGDLSAMCGFLAIPNNSATWNDQDRRQTTRRLMLEGAARKHSGCLAYLGGALLLGNSDGIEKNEKVAKPMLIESAMHGYYVAARRLYTYRMLRILKDEFDYTDTPEIERANCWGRLAQQHTSWTQFPYFLERIRAHANTNGRKDLLAIADKFDPKRVPSNQKVVQPIDCIKLERGE